MRRQLETSALALRSNERKGTDLQQVGGATLCAILQDVTIKPLRNSAHHHLHIKVYRSLAPVRGAWFQPSRNQTNASPAFAAVGGEPGGQNAAIGAGDNCGVVIVVDEGEAGGALGHGDVDEGQKNGRGGNGRPLGPG
jgi:hypothetical protein